MTKKKTDEEFKQEVYNLVGDEYTFLEEYQGTRAKIKVKHNKCGHEYEVRPYNLLRGDRCPYCASNVKKTTKQFKDEVYNLVGDEYSVLGEYKRTMTKLKVKHNICDTTYEVTPNAFLRGDRCPKCAITSKSNKRRKTTEQFKQEVYNLVGDEYSVLGDYQGTRNKIIIKHNACDYVYKVRPYSFLAGSRCPKCAELTRVKKRTKTTQQFKQEVYNLVGDEYSVLSDYANSQTKVLMKHNACGSEYRITPRDFLAGNRCPRCYQTGISYGNEAIAKYLDEHNINYEREYRFKDCVYKASLPFDFYLPTLNICIEYDGKQHYVKNNFFEKHDPFKERQIKDKIKSKYCHDNGIKLIRIKYTQFNQIEDILDKELSAK